MSVSVSVLQTRGLLPAGKRDEGRERDGGRFMPGLSGNPSGRPKGARGSVAAALIEALADDFDLHGRAVVAQVRLADPVAYLKVIAGLLPRQIEAEEVPGGRPMGEYSRGELLAIVAMDTSITEATDG